MRRSLGCALICCVLAVASLSGQQIPAPLLRFLRQSIALDTAQIAAMERGEAVVKVLDTKNQRDVAVFGIITVDVPRASYIGHVQDFQSSLRTPTRARFGIFSDPATPEDVQDLELDADDVSELKDCRPNDCKIKLSAAEMKRLREEIDWSGADPVAQVSAYARQRLLEYVTAYRARGDTAMVVYDNRGNVRASSAFAALLSESPYVYEFHYFEAGLDLTTVVDRPTAANPGIYVMLLRRSRFDDLPTGLFNIRGKVIGKRRDQMRVDLDREKATAEQLR